MRAPRYGGLVLRVRMAGGIGGLPSFGPGFARRLSLQEVPEDTGVAQIAGPPPAAVGVVREVPLEERPGNGWPCAAPAGCRGGVHRRGLGFRARGRSAVDLPRRRHRPATQASARAWRDRRGAGRDPGVGTAKAAQLVAAAFELGRRLLADWPAGRWTIRAAGRGRQAGRRDGPPRTRGAAGLSLNAKNVVQRACHDYAGNVSASLVRVGSCSVMPSGSMRRAWSWSTTTLRRATPPHRRTTSISPPRRSPPAGCSTSSSWTTL